MANFDAGLGIRATSRETGLDKKTVSKYYHARPATKCPCGKPMTHRGWCSFRVARSPGRQKFLARRVTLKEDTKLKWLAITNFQSARKRYIEILARLDAAWCRQAVIRENDLLGPGYLIEVARSAVIGRCDAMIADDVVQDLLLEMVSGNLEAGQTLFGHPIVTRIVNKNYKMLLPAANRSIDAELYDGGLSYADKIPADAPLFHYAAIPKGGALG